MGQFCAKRGNGGVNAERGRYRAKSGFVRTAITEERIPTLRHVVSVFAVPLHKLMKDSVTTGSRERRENESHS